MTYSFDDAFRKEDDAVALSPQALGKRRARFSLRSLLTVAGGSLVPNH
jgi:hypothetical protein